MALRWGICSAGKISHDFVCAVQTLPAGNHEIVAVAARNLTSAKDFANSHGIPQFFDSYETLAKCEDIDIIYVGVINTGHLDVSKMMLEHGKHVLCEKPLTMNKKQTTELIELARKKKLFMMEAVWSRFFPAYKALREKLDSGIIGDVVNIHVPFGFNLRQVDRLNLKELGGGTILDLGVYALQFCQFVYKGLKPIKFVASGSLNDQGVDDSARAIIEYCSNKSATLSISSLGQYSNEAIIVGTKGMIKVPNFWSPTEVVLPDETLKFELPASPATYNFNNSVGLCYEAEECRRCIKQGLIESPGVSHDNSCELAELMDTWRKEVGVVYPVD